MLRFYPAEESHTKDAKGAKEGKTGQRPAVRPCLGGTKPCPGAQIDQSFSPMNTNSPISHTENPLSKIILDAAFKVHTKSGPGMLRTFHEVVLAHELRKLGLHVEREVPIRIYYDDLVFDGGFRADLAVEGKVIVELKSVE